MAVQCVISWVRMWVRMCIGGIGIDRGRKEAVERGMGWDGNGVRRREEEK